MDRNKNKAYVAYIYIHLLLLFVSVFERIINNYFPLKQLLILLCIACLALLFIINYNNKIIWGLLAFLFVIFVYSCITTNNLMVDLINWGSYVYTLLTFLLLAKKEFRDEVLNLLDKNVRLINIEVFAIGLITLLMLILNLGNSTIWGGEQYFIGFSEGAASIGTTLLAFLSLVLIVSRRYNNLLIKYLYLVLSYIFIYAVLQTGIRALVLSLIVYLILFIVVNFKVRKDLIIHIIISMIIFILLLCNSMFISKNITQLNISNSTKQNKQNVDTTSSINMFTNGRISLITEGINCFNSKDIKGKLFGTSIEELFEYNERKGLKKTHAHNDIINVINSIGIFGLCLYIYAFVITTKELFNHNRKLIIEMFIFILVFGYFILEMLTLSLYSYIVLVFGLEVFIIESNNWLND